MNKNEVNDNWYFQWDFKIRRYLRVCAVQYAIIETFFGFHGSKSQKKRWEKIFCLFFFLFVSCVFLI